MNRELLKKNFENHEFHVSFFDTGAEAAQYLLTQIKDTTVATGGSMTMQALGLFDALKAQNKYYSHTPKEDLEAFREELSADVFICSANGVSETGEIVNIDGTCNRVAGTIYGHNRVYLIVGKNKIVPTLADAIVRAKEVASPPNCKRLNRNTPCAVTGKCIDCNSPERICHVTVIEERPPRHLYTEVVFVDEELGF